MRVRVRLRLRARVRVRARVSGGVRVDVGGCAHVARREGPREIELDGGLGGVVGRGGDGVAHDARDGHRARVPGEGEG